jgi:hypothetical protein
MEHDQGAPYPGDKFNTLAAELIGISQMPLADAATVIIRSAEAQRKQILVHREETSDTSPLDPELFPESVFNSDGSRKSNHEGRSLLTQDEWRAYYEREDSRHTFN